jgi:hypothetical protein
MRVPHVRVLQALADAGEPLTLSQLTTAAGYNEGSGTASRALYGVPEGSSSGPEQTGLLELGYVHDEQIESEGGGRAVKHFSITASGKKALEEELAATGGELPPPEDDSDHNNAAPVPTAAAPQSPAKARAPKRWQCRSYGCWGNLVPMKPNQRRGSFDMICEKCGCPDWSDPRKI